MICVPQWLQGVRRMVRLQNAMMVLCAVLVSAYGASMCASLHRAYHQAIDDATATLESIARSSEVGTNRSIFAIDAALLGVERMLETVLPDTPLSDRQVKALLNQFDDETLVVRDIMILDPQGRLLNKASWTVATNQDFSKEPFFTAHQAGGMPSLFISQPRRSPATGGWSVMMSRPLMRRGQALGVIVAEVPITVFSDFYNSVVANSGVRVKLLLDEGTVLATEPHQEDLIGGKLDNAAPVLAAAAKRRFGVLGKPDREIDSPLVLSYARIPARPLLLVASRSRNDILRKWRDECVNSVAAFILFGLTAGCLTWLMVRAVDRQQKAVGKLQASEERLQRQSDLLQSTLENMGEGLSVFDRRGALVAWNGRFVEMLDLPIDLPAETTLRDILTIQAERGDFGHVDAAADVERRIDRFFRDVPSVRERLTGQGRTLLIRRRGMPNGAVVSIYSDITERKAADVKMAQAWAQAELANRAKTDFLANMSHELRTPLNAIIGFSEILSGEHLGPLSNARYLEYAHDIRSSGLHLLSIINDVLDMSKIEAGKLDIHEEEVALAPLLSTSLRMVRERARQQQVELVSNLAHPDHGLFIDERAIKQCLLNVLSNAIKFSPMGGTVTVEAKIDREERTIITIADQGIGMTEDEKERALQPFGQAHSSTTRTYGGTGLGLPITQGLVEAHGGMMTISSRPGEGTCVTLTLPATRTRTSAPAEKIALRA